MRGFILLCLTAVALAAPQGYNYNPAPSAFGGSFSSGGVSTASGGSAFFQAAHQAAPQQQQTFFPQQHAAVPVVQHHQQVAVQQQQAVHHQQAQAQAQQTLVSKRFYIHTAPEDVDEEYKERHITVGVPKRNYNVVFIKSPQRSNKRTSIKISPAVNEEKTVIYVLNKKADSSDVHAEVIEHASSTSKPEVFFIKYKTNEEAAHAQQQIQAQYDALGGSSQITDEGVAPVTSVIGALGGGDAHGDAGTAVGGGAVYQQQTTGVAQQQIVSSGSSGAHSGNAYLPPNF